MSKYATPRELILENYFDPQRGTFCWVFDSDLIVGITSDLK